MPEQLHGSIRLSLDPLALGERPQLTAQIAIISSCWASIEDELAYLFLVALHGDKDRAATDSVGLAVFGVIPSLANRLDMVKKGIELRFPGRLDEFNKLSRRTKKHGKKRNLVVHSLWTVHEDHPDALLRFRGLTRMMGVEKFVLRDFVEIEKCLAVLHQDLKQFSESL